MDKVTVDLRLGDCLKLMTNIPDKSIDLILADLPYGKTIQKWDEIIDFELLWKEYERIRTENCLVALFGAEPFSSALRMSNIQNFRYDWIWHKSKPSGMALAKKQPMRIHEIISIFYQGSYYPIKEDREGFTKKSIRRFASTKNLGTYKNHGDNISGLGETKLKPIERLRYPTTIKRFGSIVNRFGKNFHPNQKPIELLEYIIKTYTLAGQVVLDNTMGSGSTGVACIKLNRNFIGIERDQKYYAIAQKRIKEERQQMVMPL